MDRNTLRILNLCGGGTKGYGSNRFMQKFLHQWGINQSDLWKYIDVMSGTSIGGILACSYAYGLTPDEMESFFLNDAQQIFTNSSTSLSSRPSSATKVLNLTANTPFYTSPADNSNYGPSVLQQLLINNFGDSTLANLKTNVIVPAFETSRSRFTVFSSFDDPTYFASSNTKLVDVCRATSAAPIYLPSYSIGDKTYIDGGVYANDPVNNAINVGLTLKPHAERIVVMDVGTGIGNTGFDGSMDASGNHAIQVLFSLMNTAMTGSEEWTRYNLDYLSKRLNKNVYYYKFQPRFPPDFPNELDNSTADWFASLANLIDSHYAEQSDKITDILTRLTI